MSKKDWERKGALLVHSQHGVGTVEEADNEALTVTFQDANPSTYARRSRPWFEFDHVTERQGEMLDITSTLQVRVSREIIEKSVSGKGSSCWSFLEAAESAEKSNSDVQALSELILEQEERPVAFGSTTKRQRIDRDIMSTTSLLRQLDRYRDTDSREMSPSEYMLVVVQLSDGYSRRAIELTKVSNGNGGFRISERDIVKARDERRNMIREIKNGSAWGNLVFPSFPLGMSKMLNMSISSICQKLSRGSSRRARSTTKALLSAFEERTRTIFLPVAERAEAEANEEIVRRTKKPSSISMTSVREPNL